MRKAIREIQKVVQKMTGNDVNTMIVTSKGDDCGIVMHGSVEDIALAIFTVMHSPNEGMALDVYRIIKLLTLNILNNESPYSADLASSILNAAEEPYLTTKKGKAIIVPINGENE